MNVPKGQPECYEQRLIAFVDILGFSELVRTSAEDEQVFKHLVSVLETVAAAQPLWDDPETEAKMWSFVEGGPLSFNEHRSMLKELAKKDQATVFSDSIVLSSTPDCDGAFAIFAPLCQLAQRLALSGVLVRGGVTIGPLHHQGSVVFGPALVEAYHIESKVAVYPRILISDAALSAVEDTAGSNNILLTLRSLIRLDFDGLSCLDVLGPSAFGHTDPFTNRQEFFSSVSDHVGRNLREFRPDRLGDTAKWRYFERYSSEASGRNE
jgi:hypothetical protein